MNRRSSTAILICFFACSLQLGAQALIAKKVQSQAVDGFQSYDLFSLSENHSRNSDQINEILTKSDVLDLDSEVLGNMMSQGHQAIQIKIPTSEGSIQLDLIQVNFVSENFRINLASGSQLPQENQLFYWGVVHDVERSMSAISIYDGQLSGLISYGGEVYNLVKEEGSYRYLVFKEKDMKVDNPFDCFVDDSLHYVGPPDEDGRRGLLTANADNCVNLYVEVDHDIVVNKGGAQPAADYVMAAFNQVAILYANEAINFQVGELFVWDVEDPYVGPSTADYLNQFKTRLSGQYNGDVAHLVGNKGSGGIAYVDALCSKSFAVGYSDINNTFNNVPTYSWTIEVLTHEIGHNFGSPHTHACAWNGNNTAIDGCGSSLGYGGCPGPIPSKGTIMSYCHLVQGVGIDFNLGFGPQPGDLIRDRVYNASCLTPCSTGPSVDAAISAIEIPSGEICASAEIIPSLTLTNAGTETLSSVDIIYRIDNGSENNFSWTGSLASGASEEVILPVIMVAPGPHTFTAATSNPNGTADHDPANDSRNSSFTVVETLVFYADADGDGFGDPNQSVEDCSQPAGYVEDNTDCDDNNDLAYPGAPCDDGDGCTIGDLLDVDCQCSGTFTDSDGDGVCDSEDICEGGDDNIDSDNDGVPDFCDCSQKTVSFTAHPLNHSGSGTSSTSVVLDLDSKDASFTISGLDAVLNGNPTRRYEDVVMVTYIDGDGANQSYGTFSGSAVSSVTVSIQDIVNSITVTLQDGYDGNSQGQSIDLTEVTYCASGNPCVDSDGDGVCDENDPCPNLDQITLGFDPASLDHSGPGSSASLLTFPANSSEVSFSISDLSAKTSGNPKQRYIEVATVYYDDGTGEQVVDVLRGDQNTGADVLIPGTVVSLRVELSDGYNEGANSQNLNVSLSDATACVVPSGLSGSLASEEELLISVFPNPAVNQLLVNFSQEVVTGNLFLSDILGNRIAVFPIKDQQGIRIDLKEKVASPGILMLTLKTSEGQVKTRRVIVSQ